jgi:hypothetical protein
VGRGGFLGRALRGPQHVGSAGGVHRQHPYAELRRRGDATRDGVRNVVKFQIQENAVPLFDQPPHEWRTFSRKQLIADLEASNLPAKASRKLERVNRIVYIERD